ncbi:hypothetical protein K461DRAFT_95612 [Myriangium duriaei CBS 260.36]|uniref:Uncharacterized protein n=1 Tax=Myriangium duriaei CBS 260.36 TaxID=1168546 RepID=A0A9P4J7P7_9PEZI|nr:hypothetical protein K461DRAFT_95612 [Myriangium duriaei CBS 260.36]
MPRLSQIPVLGPIARDVSFLSRSVAARISPPTSPRDDFPRAEADAQVWAWLASSGPTSPTSPHGNSNAPSHGTTTTLQRRGTTRSSRLSHHESSSKRTHHNGSKEHTVATASQYGNLSRRSTAMSASPPPRQSTEVTIYRTVSSPGHSPTERHSNLSGQGSNLARTSSTRPAPSHRT